MMNCCICGTVRNCGKFLDKIFKNIEIIGSIFNDYKIIMFYDSSSDNTLDKLKKYKLKNPKFSFFENKVLVSPYRTHRLAHARNFCLDYVKSLGVDSYPFFIMMDCDDVNCKELNVNVLKKYLTRDDWDALSFNTRPKYYDIWALSIYPYCFSYNHFVNNRYHNYSIIQNFITRKLNMLKPGELLQCISSFNGFSIYRLKIFMNSRYDGNVRKDLLPYFFLQAHARAANTRSLIYKDYGHVKGKYEDCEHRAFHIDAINRNNAKIMISNEILFTG